MVAEDKTTDAKYALRPIPGARATGKLMNSPMAMVKIPAAKAVARNTEYQPMSMRPKAVRVPGFTDKIYAIAIKVVRPAIISVRTVVPFSFNLKKRFKLFSP
ncbi:hypothetical protein D3C81_1846460 [compost metagenome]